MCGIVLPLPRLLNTYEVHSGYSFPVSLFGGDARFHDFHHSKNVGAYSDQGVVRFLPVQRPCLAAGHIAG